MLNVYRKEKGMKFWNNNEDRLYAYSGVWTESDDMDVELLEIDVDEHDDDLFEVTVYDCQTAKAWFEVVRIIRNGAITVYDADDGTLMGHVYVNDGMSDDAQLEQYLLGIYDVIEMYYA